MTTTTQITLFKVFKEKFGEDQAQVIVAVIEDTIDNKIEGKKDVLLTKDDKVDLIRWMVGLWLTTFVSLAVMIIGLYIRK